MELHRVETKRGLFYKHVATAYDGHRPPPVPVPSRRVTLIERVKITKINTPVTSRDFFI